MSTRNTSIDIAKGVAIIAIVLGHIDYAYPQTSLLNVGAAVYGLWHVAVFFLLGGFFIKEEQLKNPRLFFKKKFSSLYLKILYFYVPAVLLHNVLIRMGWYSVESSEPLIREYGLLDFVKQMVFAVCLGGREPILGAMWFVYVLFMALIGLSVVSWLTHRVAKDERQYEWLRGITLLTLCIATGIVSNKYGFTIRRCSNLPTAMMLIYVGMMLYQRVKLTFNNGYLCVVCALVALEVVCMLGGVALNGNSYKDICQLLVAAPCVLYTILYIAKHIEQRHIGRAIAYVGNNSFYVMALHFVGFKLCASMLAAVKGGGNLADLTPDVGHSLLLLLLYALFGVGIPLVFMWAFSLAKGKILKLSQRIYVSRQGAKNAKREIHKETP